MKLTLSRRERMVYITLVLVLAFGVFMELRGCSLLEATSFTAPLVMLAGYYVKQETERKSINSGTKD